MISLKSRTLILSTKRTDYATRFGIKTEKTVLPGRLSTVIEPTGSFINRLQMLRPNPVTVYRSSRKCSFDGDSVFDIRLLKTRFQRNVPIKYPMNPNNTIYVGGVVADKRFV